jgi:hypothetical protein
MHADAGIQVRHGAPCLRLDDLAILAACGSFLA